MYVSICIFTARCEKFIVILVRTSRCVDPCICFHPIKLDRDRVLPRITLFFRSTAFDCWFSLLDVTDHRSVRGRCVSAI